MCIKSLITWVYIYKEFRLMLKARYSNALSHNLHNLHTTHVHQYTSYHITTCSWSSTTMKGGKETTRTIQSAVDFQLNLLAKHLG